MDVNSITPEIGPEPATEALAVVSKTPLSAKLLVAANPVEVPAARGSEPHEDVLVSVVGPSPSGEWLKTKVTTWKR
jgi:hypothetical protein